MLTSCYPAEVLTIEQIRLQNYATLIKELGRERGYDLKDPEVAAALGISKVYAWQIRNKKRSAIDSKAARKMEAMAGKPLGWLDTNFDLWPFPGIDAAAFERLSQEQKLEIQGSVRSLLLAFEKKEPRLGGESSESGDSQLQAA